jgi:hypothetical protein
MWTPRTDRLEKQKRKPTFTFVHVENVNSHLPPFPLDEPFAISPEEGKGHTIFAPIITYM